MTTVAAAREALISAEALLAEMETSDANEVALICQAQNVIGSRFALIRARQDRRLRECAGGQASWDNDWTDDADPYTNYPDIPAKSVAVIEPAKGAPEKAEEPKAEEIAKPETRRAAADRFLDDLRAEVRRPGASNPEPKRKNKTADPCEVDGCIRRARSGGRCVVHSRTVKPKEGRKLKPDGTCSWGCGRKPRSDGKSASCRACATHRRMVPTCVRDTCGKAATGLGGYCSYHDRHLR